MPSAGLIHVVAGAVTAADGRILIAQRPSGKPLAGGWEFPGGKLEPGESRPAGLARELAEELGIAIREPRPLIRVRHTYSHGEVLIDMWVVTRYEGIPRDLDGQALRWLTHEELETAELLPADKPIVRALRLPATLREAHTAAYAVADTDFHRVPPSDSGDGDAGRLRPALLGRWCATREDAQRAAASGADFLVMRQPVSDLEAARLCGDVAIPIYLRAAALEAAFALGATGIHDLVSASGI